MSIRNINLGDTFEHYFTTRQYSDGAPTTLAGTPAMSVIDTGAAMTGGVSLTADYRTVTGLNQVQIVATSGNNFTSGHTYAIYISTGTVGGTSVVGEVIGHFTIEKAGGDTGPIATAVWGATTRGLTQFIHDTGIWASNYAGGRALTIFAHDTGIWGSNFASGRTLTAFPHDTGVADTVWKASTSAYTADTGSVAYAQGRVMAAHADTGAIHIVSGRLAASDSGIVAAVLDTGKVAAAVWVSHAARTVLDTGIVDGVWEEQVSEHAADTGSMAYAQGRLMAVNGDTGAAHLDAGRLGVTAAATVDTGEVSDAVWGKRTPGDGTRALTDFPHDTGVADTTWKYASRALTAFNHDTGIWGSNFASGRTLTAFPHDTGVADTVWKASESTYTDTGSMGYAQGRLQKVHGDTGAAHIVNGRLSATDSGVVAAVLDTGKVAASVWVNHAARTVLDTGIADAFLDRDMSVGSDQGSATVRTVRQALRSVRNRVEVDTGSITVYKEDDTTVSWSGTTEHDTGSNGVKTIDPASA